MKVLQVNVNFNLNYLSYIELHYCSSITWIPNNLIYLSKFEMKLLSLISLYIYLLTYNFYLYVISVINNYFDITSFFWVFIYLKVKNNSLIFINFSFLLKKILININNRIYISTIIYKFFLNFFYSKF